MRRRWCCRWIRPRNCSPPTPAAQADQFLALMAELLGPHQRHRGRVDRRGHHPHRPLRGDAEPSRRSTGVEHGAVQRAQTDAVVSVQRGDRRARRRAARRPTSPCSLAPDLVERLLADAGEGRRHPAAAVADPGSALHRLARRGAERTDPGHLRGDGRHARCRQQRDRRGAVPTPTSSQRAAGAAAVGVHSVAGHRQSRQRPADAASGSLRRSACGQPRR